SPIKLPSPPTCFPYTTLFRSIQPRGVNVKLHEYQSKFRFAEFGIPIPRGKIATTPEEAFQIAKEIGGPTVVKAQVLVGGRGKAGDRKSTRLNSSHVKISYAVF